MPVSVTSVPEGPGDGLTDRVAVVVVNCVETMKFVEVVPFETATHALPLAQVMVIPEGIAPPTVVLKVSVAGHPTAAALAAQQ